MKNNTHTYRGASTEERVMANVAVIYTARKLTSKRALAFYALAVSALGIISTVSLTNVFQNFALVAQAGIPSVVGFILAALFTTKIAVQASLLVASCALVALMVDTVRPLTTHSAYRRS